MKAYLVYWIRKEFAYRYFYKSDVLFRFIKLYLNNKDRHDLSVQHDYITNIFPKSLLIAHIKKHQTFECDMNLQGNQLEIYRNRRCISLHIHKTHLKFRCDTIHDAEMLLFPTLRSFDSSLFIIDENLDNYGWISPVKKELSIEI